MQKQGFIVVSLDESSAKVLSSPKKSRLRKRFLTQEDKAIFCRQLATLITANVPLLKSFDIILTQTNSIPLYRTLEAVKKDLEAGSSLSSAMDKHQKVFPKLWVYMVEVAEASGQLPQILNEVTNYEESAIVLKNRVISALIYPVILLFVSFGAIFIFMVKIVPTFAGILKTFNVKMPLLTVVVIDISNFLRRSIPFFVLFIVGFIIFLNRYTRTPRGKWNIDNIKFKMPLFGGLYLDMVIERFASGMSTMIRSGVNILSALDLISKTIANSVFSKMLEVVKEDIKQGISLADSLSKTHFFPLLVTNMINVGEETGKLHEILNTVGKYYDDKISTNVTRLTAALEPAMIVFMGVVIGLLVAAMFLPLFKLAQIM